ncbi:MAG: hypothetical protein FJ104_11935 [Deltaproteobacteria bacterium]|nr:hypothetical protein [Deltaproteobacteria bacterium]
MPEPDFDPAAILATLRRHAVDFVVVDGLAGLAHGSQYPTADTDVVYARGRENLLRLAAALRELGATLRGAPPGLPFQLDAETLRAGANFTFDTTMGPLDILGDAAGAPRYELLHDASMRTTLFSIDVHVASLDHLIAMKEAAGRPKDILMASEYRTISDELRRDQS